MKKSNFSIILTILFLLTACQSNKHTISSSQAENLPILSSLPLLSVKEIQNRSDDGYSAILTDSEKMLFRTIIDKKNLADSYIRLNKGDQVKIIGDYTENNPIEITPSKIIRIR